MRTTIPLLLLSLAACDCGGHAAATPPTPEPVDAGPSGNACANMVHLGCGQNPDCAPVLDEAVANGALSTVFRQCLATAPTPAALRSCGEQVRCVDDPPGHGHP